MITWGDLARLLHSEGWEQIEVNYVYWIYEKEVDSEKLSVKILMKDNKIPDFLLKNLVEEQMKMSMDFVLSAVESFNNEAEHSAELDEPKETVGESLGDMLSKTEWYEEESVEVPEITIPEKKRFGKEKKPVKKARYMKSRDKYEKPKVPRTIKQGTASIILISIAALVIGIGGFGGYRTFLYENKIESLKKNVQSLAETQQDTAVVAYPYQERLSVYLSEFIGEYMNVPINADKKKERSDSLKEMFAAGVSENEQIAQSSDKERKLLSYEIMGVTNDGETDVANVVVRYEVGEKEYTNLLNIPFKETSGEKFTVISLPYLTVVPDLKGSESGFVIKEESSSSDLPEKETAEVKQFLNLFLEKYASGTKEELAFLMKTVEGRFDAKFEEVLTTTIRQGKDEVQVEAVVVLEEEGYRYTENLTLYLKKTNDQYTVETLKHYIKQGE